MTALDICEHTRNTHFPLYRSTPTPVLHAQSKEQKRCGAQGRESIRGPVSSGKHHHAASHQSWDSTTLRQTKLLAHRSLLQSSISLTSFFFHFIVCSCSYFTYMSCYLFFALSGYCPNNSFNQIILETQQADSKCTQLITNTLIFRDDVTVLTLLLAPAHCTKLDFHWPFCSLG